MKNLIVCLFLFSYLSGDFVVSHTEGKGLGYSEGYTTFGFVTSFEGEQLFPFVDLRGHVFNNGKCAGNWGFGLRWLSPECEQIWGINAFYDNFCLKRLSGHQVTMGLEWMTETWDFSLNGYIPVSCKKTNIYTLSYGLFRDGFLAKAKEQVVLGGVDFDIGYRFFCNDYFDLSASLGPYFYWGKTAKTKNAFRSITQKAYGGRLRGVAAFLGAFELEAIASYDSRFKWTGQATVSIDLFALWNCRSCCIQDRLYEPVRRNEMMVIDTVTRVSSNPLILDPEYNP